MATRSLRHVPTRDFIAIAVNESNGSGAGKMAIEHVPQRRFLVLNAS